MKPLWIIKNRHGRRGAPRLSLFPFLAVLICTMGALVLLLLSVTRQARLQAVREAAAKNAERQSSIASEMEMVQWRVDQLKKSRKETEAQLADARLVLGHIEDHGRRLREQFQDLTRQAKNAADEGLKPGRFVAAGEAELRQIEAQIAEVQERLAQAQQAAASRPKSYAIVPYDGPNHTRRRPIYIECRGDAVVLQPEGIAFKEDDFDEPLGPGNPLAAAVRAAREQMRLQGSADPQNTGEPYPLLLVRPSGILFYECALVAMQSWGSEFGYELINEDWQLNYPPPDPNLGKAIEQAIFLARQEHARLIAAAPSKYGKRSRIGGYRSSVASATEGQGGAGDQESPGVYASKPAPRYGNAYDGSGSSANRNPGQGVRGSGGSGRSGENSGSGGGTDSTGPSGDAEFTANNPYGSLSAPGTGGPGGVAGGPASVLGGPGTGPGNGPGYSAGTTPGQGAPGAMAGNAAMNPGGPGNGSGYPPGNGTQGEPGTTVPGSPQSASMAGGPGTGVPGSPQSVPRPEGYIDGRPNDGNPAPVQPPASSTAGMVARAPLRPGEWRPNEEPPKPDPAELEKEKQEKKKHPYDKVEIDHDQDDWALRNARQHAAAISRPIHVDCYPDRIVLMPEANGGEPRVIFCGNGGQRDADKLVAAVWEIMDTWGMAGREMYWRPVLNFYVVPGGEPRLLDISRSLQGSGLVIERKQ